MIRLTIDGKEVFVNEGATLLDAARKLNIRIPTLCYHPDQEVKANCRICMVEVEG
ncbi:MAG: (2Fe-2S)-binding protein, partial [Clostridia bacterium]|nr:(2Fe-2S)-binding protein [Clostridia bacterium]